MPLAGQTSYRLPGRQEPPHGIQYQGVSRFNLGGKEKGVTCNRPATSEDSVRQRVVRRHMAPRFTEPYTVRAPYAGSFRPKTCEAGVDSRRNVTGSWGPHRFAHIERQNKLINSLRQELTQLRAIRTPFIDPSAANFAHGGRVQIVSVDSRPT